jgi:hypothetical protein
MSATAPGTTSSNEYSNAPLCTIDCAALKASRFLIPATRELPYRDEYGRITLSLIEESLVASKQMQYAAPEVLSKLSKWEKHCRAAVAASRVTWENVGHGVWRSSRGEERRAVGQGAAAAAATTPATGGDVSMKVLARVPAAKAAPVDKHEKSRSGGAIAADRMSAVEGTTPLAPAEASDAPQDAGAPAETPCDLTDATVAAPRDSAQAAAAAVPVAKKRPATADSAAVSEAGCTKASKHPRMTLPRGGGSAVVAPKPLPPPPDITALALPSKKKEVVRAGAGGKEASVARSMSAGAQQKRLREPAEYQVESIVSAKGKGRARRYLVKWAGYSAVESTWEPAFHLHPQLVAEFEDAAALASPTSRPAPVPVPVAAVPAALLSPVVDGVLEVTDETQPCPTEREREARAALVRRMVASLHGLFKEHKHEKKAHASRNVLEEWTLGEALDALSENLGTDLRVGGRKAVVKQVLKEYVNRIVRAPIYRIPRKGGKASADDEAQGSPRKAPAARGTSTPTSRTDSEQVG